VNKAKILFFDLETVALPFTTGERIRSEDCAVVCFGYAWGEEGKAQCVHSGQFPKDFAKDPFNDKKILAKAAEQILQADIVVAHYGSGFDKPLLRTRFILNGFDEAATHLQRIKCYDTCIVARKLLRLRSSSLRHIAKMFGLGEKDPMTAHDWLGVMRSKKASIIKMAKYCAKDVELLRKVYLKLRGYDNKHPSIMAKSKELSCPTCASLWIVTLIKPWMEGKNLFSNHRCRKCGSSFKGGKI
jgi:uncharacterized protein YprB with RNaseH-like and TPR domain